MKFQYDFILTFQIRCRLPGWGMMLPFDKILQAAVTCWTPALARPLLWPPFFFRPKIFSGTPSWPHFFSNLVEKVANVGEGGQCRGLANAGVQHVSHYGNLKVLRIPIFLPFHLYHRLVPICV